MKINVAALDVAADQLLHAAIDPTKWPSVLERISVATGSVGVNVLPIRGRAPGVPATESMEAPLREYFEDEWHLKDFRMRGVPKLIRTGTMIEQDFADADIIRNESYYKLLIKHGIGLSGIVGFNSGDDILCFVMQRGLKQGAFTREEEGILLRLQDRLSLSASVMRTVSAGTTDGIAEAFDAAELACFFFDRHGRVSKINQSAEAIVGNGLQVARGEIRTWRPQDAAALRERLSSVLSARLLIDPKNVGPIFVSRLDKRPLIVRVQRLTGALSDVFSHSVALAIVLDPEIRSVPHTQTMIGLFGLTKTQASIALLLAEGTSTREIAERQGISYETTRSHISSIFRKTDTNRQSSLASLLSSLRLF